VWRALDAARKAAKAAGEDESAAEVALGLEWRCEACEGGDAPPTPGA
jgi:hypothetical protein